MTDFSEPSVAIIKHNNACGVATRSTLLEAWHAALAGDPVSAFGGVIIANRVIDMVTATEIHKLFFEILISPGFEEGALELLKQKTNRNLLRIKSTEMPAKVYRSVLNGILEQDRDLATEGIEQMKQCTVKAASNSELADMVFANKIAKHSKSNTIVLAKNQTLLGSGIGQTSRVDALKQAIHKAGSFGFDLHGAVMASDAFFPFPDCVEIAKQAGITAVIQPGGSIKDKDSIAYCDANDLAMVMTGTRHFKH
jgi:phosphoribosylaminoimidazolecarboxamide formyltransferase/IMP cyclohydrolase